VGEFTFLFAGTKKATYTPQNPKVEWSCPTLMSAPPASPAKRAKKGRRRYYLRSSVAPIFSTTRLVNAVPVVVWREHVCQDYLNLRELSVMRRVHTFFDLYWPNTIAKNTIRVPRGYPTAEKAMALAVILSKRRDYGFNGTLRIVLGKGIHDIVGKPGDKHHMMDVAFSHITFVGKGKDQTTIRGGFKVCNQQNVRFEELAVMNSWDTNPNSCRPMGYVEHRMGFDVRGNEINVVIFKGAVKHCIGPAMHVLEATVTATQCEFTENQLIKHNNNSGRLPNSPQCCPCPPPTQHIAQQQRWWGSNSRKQWFYRQS